MGLIMLIVNLLSAEIYMYSEMNEILPQLLLPGTVHCYYHHYHGNSLEKQPHWTYKCGLSRLQGLWRPCKFTTGSITLKCMTFCQEYLVFQDRSSLMAVVPQDKFHCRRKLRPNLLNFAIGLVESYQYMHLISDKHKSEPEFSQA